MIAGHRARRLQLDVRPIRDPRIDHVADGTEIKRELSTQSPRNSPFECLKQFVNALLNGFPRLFGDLKAITILIPHEQVPMLHGVHGRIRYRQHDPTRRIDCDARKRMCDQCRMKHEIRDRPSLPDRTTAQIFEDGFGFPFQALRLESRN